MIILGRVLKYFLWFCFFALLGAFLFGLIRFKGDLPGYINYLNQINISDLVEEDLPIQEIDFEEDISNIEEDSLNLLDDDGFFLPSYYDDLDEEDEEYGFVDVSKNTETIVDVSPSTSKEDLINLIKSREE